MEVNWNAVATIAAPIVTLVGGIAIERYFSLRPKLISYLGHMSNFKIRTDNEFSVYTHSIVIRNAGRKPAHNLRVGHFVVPINYQIYPAIEHTLMPVPDTGPEIHIPIIVPGEQITISYLYYDPLTVDRFNSYTKCDEGFVKIITVLPMQQYPKWFNRTILVLSLTGFISLIYLIYEAIKHLV